ncbi:MAG TPA: 50S ribosomal protein L3 [Thermoanaerobaculia bacterium]|nr:50S ribosomal protein L3 [Thermoanaerobaculia bacterium]
MDGMLGRKLGMTQIYIENGNAVPVTVIEAGPCLVVQRRTAGKDGYEAVQLGLVEAKRYKANKPIAGHFKKAGVAPTRTLAEFDFGADEDPKPGDEVKASMFSEQEYVDVVGTSKGKGFQGVIKRHGFGGGKDTHGSMHHRAPGSIGSSAYPSRVFPGMRAPGRMGGDRITTKNLLIVKVDAEKNLIYVRGAVPGAINSYVAIRRAKRG